MRLNFPSSNPLVSRPESGEGGTTNRANLWEGLLSLIAALNKNIVSPDCLFTTTVHCQFSVFNQCQPGRPTSTFPVSAMTFDCCSNEWLPLSIQLSHFELLSVQRKRYPMHFISDDCDTGTSGCTRLNIHSEFASSNFNNTLKIQASQKWCQK